MKYLSAWIDLDMPVSLCQMFSFFFIKYYNGWIDIGTRVWKRHLKTMTHLNIEYTNWWLGKRSKSNGWKEWVQTMAASPCRVLLCGLSVHTSHFRSHLLSDSYIHSWLFIHTERSVQRTTKVASASLVATDACSNNSIVTAVCMCVIT